MGNRDLDLTETANGTTVLSPMGVMCYRLAMACADNDWQRVLVRDGWVRCSSGRERKARKEFLAKLARYGLEVYSVMKDGKAQLRIVGYLEKCPIDTI